MPSNSSQSSTFSFPSHSQDGDCEALLEILAEEMTERWRQGQHPRAEEFLDCYADLWNQPAAVMDLVYEEICLRRQHGEIVDSNEVVKRFPQWKQQLQILLDCLDAFQPPGGFPSVGETFGDFQLLSELGTGGQGRVFVGAQSSLGGRPVVLKITPCRGEEHLALARLQHTHIMPLWSVVNYPDRNLRALCMPYFGGLTLAAILEVLRDRPLAQRKGQDIADALDAARATAAVALPPCSDPPRPFLERASFVQAISWIGACLAEALKYAHDRGLLHLDVKPSNVLLSATLQPMLLDFHLARQPLPPGDRGSGLGGTPAYMSPEQTKAMAALKTGGAVPEAIDRRSDIYSLGLVLYETLGGTVPRDGWKAAVPLHRCNPQVPRGLSDIIAKCLARAPGNRYRDAGALAADLWAHLDDLPLKGVANLDLAERWHKWRRRRPHLLSLLCMLTVFLIMSGAAIVLGLLHLDHRLEEARTALADGQKLLKKGSYLEAESTLKRGLSQLERLPGNQDLRRELADHLHQVACAQLAQELHDLANRLRLLFGTDSLPTTTLEVLKAPCCEFWEKRDLILQRLGKELEPDIQKRVRLDLIDLAILGADLRVRLAGNNDAVVAHQEALHTLAQVEAIFGPNGVLYHERQMHAQAIGLADLAVESQQRAALYPPRTAWEHYAFGRSLMNSGRLEMAAIQFDRAVAMQPNGLWPNYYQGICCYRLGRFEDAALAFTACTAVAPNIAGCFYNRALAFIQLGRTDRALQDCARSLELDADLTEAVQLIQKLKK